MIFNLKYAYFTALTTDVLYLVWNLFYLHNLFSKTW